MALEREADYSARIRRILRRLFVCVPREVESGRRENRIFWGHLILAAPWAFLDVPPRPGLRFL